MQKGPLINVAEAAAFLITGQVKADSVKPGQEVRRNPCPQMASGWWDHHGLLSSPPGCSCYDSQRSAWPDYYLAAPLLSLKPSRARSCLLISAAFIAFIVKAADKENFSPRSIAEVADSQPPSVRRPSMQVLPPHWRLQSSRPLASSANLPPGASTLTCELQS